MPPGGVWPGVEGRRYDPAVVHERIDHRLGHGTDHGLDLESGAPVAISLGRLSDKVWPGPLSANGVGPRLAEVIGRLDDYYVTVDPRAKTRCIDGRHDPELDEAALGPQVPGGAPGSALAYRLGVDKDDLTRGTFTGDAEMMIESYLRLGLSPGGHRDEDAESGDGVGCGAIDGLQSVLDCMTNPTPAPTQPLCSTLTNLKPWARAKGRACAGDLMARLTPLSNILSASIR